MIRVVNAALGMAAAALMLWLAPTVYAGETEVCWQAPTQNVDGSPLTDLDAYRIYSGPSTRNYDNTVEIPDAAATCYLWTVAGGTYFVAMTALDATGNESAYSNEVIKTVEDNVPMPPIILENDSTVFTVVKQPNRFLLLAIGMAPAGTSCDPNNSTNGHGAVPTDAVVWTCVDDNTCPRPIVVVAQCSGG